MLPARRRIDQQAGARLAARAVVGIVVIAGSQRVEPDGRRHLPVQGIGLGSGLRPTRDVGLVRDGNRQAPQSPDPLHATSGRRLDLEFGDRRGRIRPAISHDRPVQHTVPIEEDGAPAAAQRTDSHLVSCALRAGCETKRCHTTAWNASACGVVCVTLTVGTITQASADLAV